MKLKYIRKNGRGVEVTASELAAAAAYTSSIIDGLYGSGLTLSPSETSILITKSGILLAQIVIAEIITWSVDGNTISLITEDIIPLDLIFVGSSELNIALLVLENAMNL